MAWNEKRRHARRSVALHGALRDGAHAVRCRVLDLSAGGARVSIDAEAPAAQSLLLEIDRFGPFRVEIVWRRASLAGLRFVEPPDAMADLVVAIGLHA